MLQDSGFTDVMIGEPVDTFGGAKGEDKARAYEVYGYAFMACRRLASRVAHLEYLVGEAHHEGS